MIRLRLFYATLEILSTADTSEIKKAYKSLCLRYHPDKNLSTQARATREFQKLQGAYNVLIDPEERSSYDDKVLQTYMRWLECRMERITSCLACETDLDTAQKTELSALEDLQTHLQLELGSVTKLITNSKSPSSVRTLSDIRICRDGGLNKAKERFQIAAPEAASETVMKQRTMELERQNLKLVNTATLLNTARAQLISKDMTLKTLGAENTKLKKMVSDYNNSMGILETSFQKVEETTNNLAIGALL
ncbi:uncharacterized protein QC763_700415 [Podospora pseudopauciseta]|uniref:J domain-containing protein n=1 Tax=Podospora pseudopauciseta TaxID=2093780 RepID=A0ABR0H2T3_9PEZI|nr:hypothetical protein QC763_700415 [Podospora pseudopauciseta]